MSDWAVAWSRRLENVLQIRGSDSYEIANKDRNALDAFRAWVSANGSSQPLELHFAIRAYGTMFREKDPKTIELARSIYSRYISLRTGCCSFIPPKIRQEVGVRVKSMHFPGDARAFDAVQPFVDAFLRKQHEQFCTSEEFVDAFNRFTLDEPGPMSSSTTDRSFSRMNTSTHSNQGTQRRSRSRKTVPSLTADALIKSQHDRENALGESRVERMYPGPRVPYVCHATTSQHDSAVSSSFSSDANRSIRLSSIREEHVRGNPQTYTIPRVERSHHQRDEGPQFDHETEDGRRTFHAVMCKKLNREIVRRRRHEATERQITELEHSNQTARDVISSTDCDVTGFDDVEEDDLERYVEMMREDSVKASANRSPRGDEGVFAVPTLPVRLSNLERSGTLDRSTLTRSGTGTGTIDRSMTGTLIDPTPGFAPPNSFPNRFAPPPSSGFESGNSFFSKDRCYSARSNSVYDSSGIESMLSEDRRKKEKKTLPKHGSNAQMITISYKGSDGVPVVAHIPYNGTPVTLRDFRRHLSISSHSKMQFFFKTLCEDGSAPYQLLLVNDDAALLPIFDGKITAEIKQMSPE